MLRKKQDEAKEILVRAFINNNNLLMLNHPIYEEKISFHDISIFIFFGVFFSFPHLKPNSFTSLNIMKVQKFAAKLLSKKLQTKAAWVLIPFTGMHTSNQFETLCTHFVGFVRHKVRTFFALSEVNGKLEKYIMLGMVGTHFPKWQTDEK